MRGLHLDTFLRAGYDLERAQYEILGGLQNVRQAFSKNIIYPHLAQLVTLYNNLRTIVARLSELRGNLPGHIRGVDLERGKLLYDAVEMPCDDVAYLEELVHWALPSIQQAIDEGRTIFEFVDDNLHMEEVGIIPSYIHEGYLIVPDPNEGVWCILQYSLSVFTGPDERYRGLRTLHLEAVPAAAVGLTPQQVKLELVAERRDLPNPATYYFASDIDFPYEETVLPVAKRKLLRYLTGQIGSA